MIGPLISRGKLESKLTVTDGPTKPISKLLLEEKGFTNAVTVVGEDGGPVHASFDLRSLATHFVH